MSLGPTSNFIPVIYAGTKKKTKKLRRKKQKGENPNDEKIHARRTSSRRT